MQEDLKTDWLKKIQDEKPEEFKDIRYIYMCPVMENLLIP
jgi:hypothetical protein